MSVKKRSSMLIAYQLNMKKGFTLIELVIVIAIIGILASIVLVGLGGFRANARDAKRIAEIGQMQNALELYFGKCGYYPGDATAAGACVSAAPPTSWTALQTVLVNARIGLTRIPLDTSYGYVTNNTSVPPRTSYILSAGLESSGNAALADDLDGTVPAGFSGTFTNCGTAGSADAIYCLQF